MLHTHTHCTYKDCNIAANVQWEWPISSHKAVVCFDEQVEIGGMIAKKLHYV